LKIIKKVSVKGFTNNPEYVIFILSIIEEKLNE